MAAQRLISIPPSTQCRPFVTVGHRARLSSCNLFVMGAGRRLKMIEAVLLFATSIVVMATVYLKTKLENPGLKWPGSNDAPPVAQHESAPGSDTPKP
jgi:hypothetical protein